LIEQVVTRFDQDMDGSMEPEESGEWVRFECIEKLIELIRSEEREACAKVCESLFDMADDSCNEAEQCAAAIRARGNE
jgi:hypothetical protein